MRANIHLQSKPIYTNIENVSSQIRPCNEVINAAVPKKTYRRRLLYGEYLYLARQTVYNRSTAYRLSAAIKFKSIGRFHAERRGQSTDERNENDESIMRAMRCERWLVDAQRPSINPEQYIDISHQHLATKNINSFCIV